MEKERERQELVRKLDSILQHDVRNVVPVDRATLMRLLNALKDPQ